MSYRLVICVIKSISVIVIAVEIDNDSKVGKEIICGCIKYKDVKMVIIMPKGTMSSRSIGNGDCFKQNA